MPPSRSTTTRMTLRRPAAVTATSSRSKPAAATTGSSAERTPSRETAATAHLPLLCCRRSGSLTVVASRINDRLAAVTDHEALVSRRAVLAMGTRAVLAMGTRAVLATGIGAGVTVLAGCTSSHPKPAVDPDEAALDAARAGERTLLAAYADGTDGHTVHLAHLRALGATLTTPTPGAVVPA